MAEKIGNVMDYPDDEPDETHDWRNCPKCKRMGKLSKYRRKTILNNGCSDDKKMMEKESTAERVWMAYGLPCVVIFVRQSHRCGYVGVPKKNPAYELNYEDVPVEIHGGLTFGNNELAMSKFKAKFKGYYWLGFDCIHSGDTMKGYEDIAPLLSQGHFWTLSETVIETEKLAKQLSKITWKTIFKSKFGRMPDWFKKRVVMKK